jgi:hypothetical protein
MTRTYRIRLLNRRFELDLSVEDKDDASGESVDNTFVGADEEESSFSMCGQLDENELEELMAEMEAAKAPNIEQEELEDDDEEDEE